MESKGGKAKGAGSRSVKGSRPADSVDGLKLYSERLEEFIKSLELLSQHVGTRMLRQQRSRTLLPIQAPPPCLGFTFLQEQHGNILKRMLMTVEQIAKGATSVEDKLKDILKHLETTKSRISIVPEELREALQKISSREEGDPLSIDGLQHPFDIMTKTKMDLERYVLLVQTISYLLLLCIACVELLCQSTSSGGNRKKRKKNRKLNQPLMSQLISFIQELKSQLTTLYHQFAPLPAPQEDDEQLREKLNRLYIGASSVTEEPHPSDEGVVSDTPSSPHQPSSGEEASVPTTVEKDTYVCAEVSQDGEGEGKGMEGVTHHAVEGPTATTGNTAGSIVPNDIHFERAVVSKVMGQVLESYNMSFRDVLKVVVTKMDLADSLVKQLGGPDTAP